VARITIEDCLKKVPSRFLLVNMVARRVRQIREGSEYLVSSPKNEDIVVSLREIAAGKLIAKLKRRKAGQPLPPALAGANISIVQAETPRVEEAAEAEETVQAAFAEDAEPANAEEPLQPPTEEQPPGETPGESPA
jgi:DNA-directed RNA polymerase subunit omega